MAVAQIRPDWTVGTLTLTSGSVNFTTTGSALQTAAIQAGDSIITRSGNFLVIATITGQNAGTLMQPCPAGAAGSGQPLRIRFQPDGSRYNGATADLVNLLGSGILYEFSALTSSADRLPYFTGVGTMGTTELTSFMRTLLGRSNGSEVYGALGVLPNAQIPPAIAPATVIENANGRAVRYADGTQICYKVGHLLPYASATIVQSFWNFPASFFTGNNPSINVSSQTLSTIGGSGSVRIINVLNQSTGTCLVRANGTGFTSSDSLAVDCTAIGRWK